ncbi:MAG TPA: O-methyltransferase [Candidatus Kapabacteria bacterium]|nr:O-methyltransferase [Candidatus Kapabacteria bacterium]
MKATPLTESTYNYIVDLVASSEESLLAVMKSKADAAGIPEIMISPEQARFIGFFLRAIKAKRVLDIGTLFGYSAAIMSEAVGVDGEVVTLEYEALHAQTARKLFRELNLENISLLQGAALDHMKTMPDNFFDFIMIDADKLNYVNYLQESLRLVRNGGIIVGDNAMAFGFVADTAMTADNPDFNNVLAIREFNKKFVGERSMFSAFATIGDGMMMGVVKK